MRGVGPWPGTQPESVHLGRFPEADASLIDEALSTEMGAVRELVSLGLKVRTDNRLKMRQPLSRVDVVLARRELRECVAHYEHLLTDELNVGPEGFTTEEEVSLNGLPARVRVERA